MALIAGQKVTKAATALTYSAAAELGDTFQNFPGVFVHARNAHVSDPRTITIAAVTTSVIDDKGGTITVPDITMTLTAGQDKLMSVPPSHTGAGGLVSMTYSDAAADITVAVGYVAQ